MLDAMERGESPASRGRGLKQVQAVRQDEARIVARFTRAWIETKTSGATFLSSPVARFTRAWIETLFTTVT